MYIFCTVHFKSHNMDTKHEYIIAQKSSNECRMQNVECVFDTELLRNITGKLYVNHMLYFCMLPNPFTHYYWLRQYKYMVFKKYYSIMYYIQTTCLTRYLCLARQTNEEMESRDANGQQTNFLRHNEFLVVQKFDSNLGPKNLPRNRILP